MLVHVHGINGIDFSSMSSGDLDVIEDIARKDDFDIVPTMFIGRDFLSQLERIVKRYYYNPVSSGYPHILGFAVEGPMLGPAGGVPPAGRWVPTSEEWQRIAALGEFGLQYIVIGPDSLELDDPVASGLTFRDVVDCFYQHNVKLALGHFGHQDPELSARRTVDVVEYIQYTYGPSPDILITDHLFNDMPRNFKHAWRTPEENSMRDREVSDFLALPWRYDNLDEILGPVPATLIREALHGRLTPVLNFDGDHVDLAICRRVVEYLGSQRMMAITDHTDSDVMAGEKLSFRPDSSLRYRSDGAVAAGSSGLDVQRRNMASIGLSSEDVTDLFANVPRRVLSQQVCVARS